MRLRSFATLLVCAALAACDGDTILPAVDLIGNWQSNYNTIMATFPDGTRPVLGRVELTFSASGEFRREVRYTDPVSGPTFPDLITEGTFTTSDGKVQATITRAYFRQGRTPATNVTLQPVAPVNDTYVYSISEGKLTFTFVCPPNAICINDPFPEYTRVLAE